MKKAILLHHAGGDKYAYTNFRNNLLPEIDSIALELPGRGDRFSENLLHDYKEIVQDYFDQLNKDFLEDYFLVGVSMGTMAAFELCKLIHQKNLPLPTHLFLSARLSPCSYKNEPSIVGISSDSFWELVQQYNGVPIQLLQHKELRELYEPILRADFNVLAKYNTIKHDILKLPVNTHIIIGKDDVENITLERAKSWSDYFTNEVTFIEFDGGHFVVYENKDVAEYIKSIVV